MRKRKLQKILKLVGLLAFVVTFSHGCGDLFVKPSGKFEDPQGLKNCGENGEIAHGTLRDGRCKDGFEGEVIEVCIDGKWRPDEINCQEKEQPEPDCIDFNDVTALNREASCLQGGCHAKFDLAKKDEFDDYLEEVIQQVKDGRMPLGKPALNQGQIDIYLQYKVTGKKEACEGNFPPERRADGYRKIEQEILAQQLRLSVEKQLSTRFISCHAFLGTQEQCHRSVEKAINMVSQVASVVRLPFENGLVQWDVDRTGHNQRDWRIIQNFVELKFTSNSAVGRQIREIAKSGQDNPWLIAESLVDTVLEKSNVYYELERSPLNFNDLVLNLGCGPVDRPDKILDGIDEFDRLM